MSGGFPDIVKELFAVLPDRMPGVEFFPRVPESRPVEFVRLWRNGGPAGSRVMDRPLVTFDAWAGSEERAFALADDLRMFLLSASSVIPSVRRAVEITGPYDNPDTESGSPRVRFSMQFTVRARRAL